MNKDNDELMRTRAFLKVLRLIRGMGYADPYIVI